MIIAVGILAYFIITLTIALIYACWERDFTKDEWFAIFMFAICPPLWISICKIAQAVRRNNEKKRIAQARAKLKGVNKDDE